MEIIRKRIRTLVGRLTLGTLLLSTLAAPCGANLTLTSPLDYQVIQRSLKDTGHIPITGNLTETDAKPAFLEARILAEGKIGDWRRLPATFTATNFQASMEVPSGGWYRLEVRVLDGVQQLAEAAVEHVGMGEVFVIAGQSNSANHGAEKQSTKTGLVTTFDGRHWRLSADPQPGASGGAGSFLPPFGDAIVEHFQVPVGLLACGIGATSVREWLPQGARFPDPPTIVDRVRQLPSGEWESKGEAFAMFTARLKPLGPRGFRAVLWHQGESDANQKDPRRTLPGVLYRQYLEKLIRDSRVELGWDVPWFVAQASYHVVGDEASPDIRAAQQSLWTDGVANEGPDTDLLKGEYRDENGRGVHFNGKGLREHAARWAEKVTPWLEEALNPLATGHVKKPELPKPQSHSVRNLEGWTVRVDDRLLAPPGSVLGARALRFLEYKLSDINVVMAAEPLAKLQSVTIVLDLNHGKLSSMQYHPDAGWLAENGYSTNLVKCVHIPQAADLPTARNITEQPWVVLHELAHAYHDQVLGFEEPRILKAYENYQRSGHGDHALLYDGRSVRHYGLTDPKEFFAEMTEAYFGLNDFFPFNRAELLTTEPQIYELMRAIWGPVANAK